MIGGRIGAAFITSGTNTDIVEGLDPATDSWTPPRERMPSARSAITYAVYKDKVLVAGGETQDRRYLAAFRAVAGGVIGDRFYVVSGDAQSAASGAHASVPYNHALQLDLVLK